MNRLLPLLVLVAACDASRLEPRVAHQQDALAGTWTEGGVVDGTGSYLYQHTATLLSDGRVLQAGGHGNNQFTTNISRLYDPKFNNWVETATAMSSVRANHAASRLKGGSVLITGGATETYTASFDSAEIYEPKQDRWRDSTSSMTTPRQGHTSTLLPSGNVLISGGSENGTSEIYHQDDDDFVDVSGMAVARTNHTATYLPKLGKVIVTGGLLPDAGISDTAEMYDPSTNSWSPLSQHLTAPRARHDAILLPSGNLLLTGGNDDVPAELFDSTNGKFSAVGGGPTRSDQSETTVELTTGSVLALNDSYLDAGYYYTATSTYDLATDQFDESEPVAGVHENSTATLLGSGSVLLVGKYGGYGSAASEILDVAVGKSAPLPGNPLASRKNFTATLLFSGKVLIAGGAVGTTASADVDIYDPDGGTWSSGQPLSTPRERHTSTLLASGELLIAGGDDGSVALKDVEIVDPSGMTSAVAPAMRTARTDHGSSLLKSGKVLITGGNDGAFGTNQTASVEIFDLATKEWTQASSLKYPRAHHAEVLMPESGMVVVAGGETGSLGANHFVEIYDPDLDRWTPGPGYVGSQFHTTPVALSGDRALVVGELSSSEYVYQTDGGYWLPSAGSGTAAISLPTERAVGSSGSDLFDFLPSTGVALLIPDAGVPTDSAQIVLLPEGDVLVLAGVAPDAGSPPGVVLNDNGDDPATRPSLTVTTPLIKGRQIKFDGQYLDGVSTGSGGSTRDSSTNFPQLLLRSMTTNRFVPLDVSDYSSTSVTTFIPSDIPSDHYILWAIVSARYSGAIVSVIDNHFPTGSSTQISVGENSQVEINLDVSDADGDPISGMTTPPAHGTLSGSFPHLVYQPTHDYSGPDSFTFTVSDGYATSDPTTVSITVVPKPVEQPPAEKPTARIKRESQYAWSCSSGGNSPAAFLAIGALLLLARKRTRAAIAIVAIGVVTDAHAGSPRLLLPRIDHPRDVTELQTLSLASAIEIRIREIGFYNVLNQDDLANKVEQERQSGAYDWAKEEFASEPPKPGTVNQHQGDCGAAPCANDSSDRTLLVVLERRDGLLSLRMTLRDTNLRSTLASNTVEREDVDQLLESMPGLLYDVLNQDPLRAAEKPLTLERGFGGLTVGIRGDVDLVSAGGAPSLTAEYAWRLFGVSLTAVIKTQPAARLEARWFPLTLGRFRPYALVGGVAGFSGAGLRLGAGLEARWNHLLFFADAAYEHYFVTGAEFLFNAVTVGLGVGWSL